MFSKHFIECQSAHLKIEMHCIYSKNKYILEVSIPPLSGFCLDIHRPQKPKTKCRAVKQTIVIASCHSSVAICLCRRDSSQSNFKLSQMEKLTVQRAVPYLSTS